MECTEGVLLTGLFNFVCHWNFSDERAALIVSAPAKRFRAEGKSLMWDLYGHDQPAGMGSDLQAAGFVRRSAELSTM